MHEVVGQEHQSARELFACFREMTEGQRGHSSFPRNQKRELPTSAFSAFASPASSNSGGGVGATSFSRPVAGKIKSCRGVVLAG